MMRHGPRLMRRYRAKLRCCGKLGFEPPDLVSVILFLFPQSSFPLLITVSPLRLKLTQLCLEPLDLSLPHIVQSEHLISQSLDFIGMIGLLNVLEC